MAFSIILCTCVLNLTYLLALLFLLVLYTDMPSSQTTFRGRPIYSVVQPKQVQLTNAFIKLANLKLL